MTAASGTYITPAQFNVHVRDNLLETEAAGAQNATRFWAVDGPNRTSEHRIMESQVSATETTTSQEYTDLASYGPSVTVACNSLVLIFTACQVANSASNASYVSYEVASVDETIGFLNEPKASRAIIQDGGTGRHNRMGSMAALSGLPGPADFKVAMKYRVSNSVSTGTFQKRRLNVMPL